MKTMIDRARDSSEPFKVESYFFYFLKLIAAAIPSIEIAASGLFHSHPSLRFLYLSLSLSLLSPFFLL